MDPELPDAPSDGPKLTVLKSNVKRTVFVERRAGVPAALVKRFHAPGLSWLRDRHRARAEADALSMARSCGLPVPLVLSVDHTPEGWELRLEWIPQARTLADVLAASGADRRRHRRAALARRIGALIADCERVGLRHPDPHPSNVLVDGGGELWLIDLARVRFGFADPVKFRRMLVVACAGIREITSVRFRAVIFRAFLRQHRVATQTPDPHGLESAARIKQRRDVERRVEVWCRTSSTTQLEHGPEGQPIVGVRAAGGAPQRGWRVERVEGARETVLAAWSTAVRATLHGVPTARPRRVSLTAPCFAELDVPIDSTPAVDGASRATLEDLLADRGLAVEGEVFVDDRGRAHVGVGAELVPLEVRVA